MTPAEAASRLDIEVRGIVFEINHKALSQSVRGMNIIYNTALEVLGHDGTGRVYKRGAKGFQIASAPGQPPAPDYGNLRRNWHKQILTGGSVGNGVRIIMRMKSKMFYQKFLEFGTRKMAPRPHVERIKTKARPQVAALFSNL